MYICETCGEIFAEPNTIYERHPYGEGFAEEAWSACPNCESTSIAEAKKCERCGEWVAELEDDLCECCHGDMYGE